MAETTMLRQNAIVRNASVGASPPHGPVKTGELSLVQVRQPPAGPQVREGQQRPVTILPPKDADSAVRTGGLPMVKVKMTDGKAKLDDGQDNGGVVIRNNAQTVAAGNLPMVQVKMENGRPQVQTVPNIAAGPPQIPSAAPALSAPRVAQSAQGPRVTRIAAPRPALAAPAPQAAPQVELPSVPEMPMDQLMLCRHAVDKYLAEQRAAVDVESVEGAQVAEVVTLAAEALKTIDETMVAIAVREEAAAQAAAFAASAPVVAPIAAPRANAYVAPRPVTGGHFLPASIVPSTPRTTGYVAPRPGVRTGGGNAALSPRRVQRAVQPGQGLPPVIVQMDNGRPMVQSGAVASGQASLPPVIVQMNNGRPQVQNPQVVETAPQVIETTAEALDASFVSDSTGDAQG